jgi:hypothetical protein
VVAGVAGRGVVTGRRVVSPTARAGAAGGRGVVKLRSLPLTRPLNARARATLNR